MISTAHAILQYNKSLGYWEYPNKKSFETQSKKYADTKNYEVSNELCLNKIKVLNVFIVLLAGL